VTVERHPIGRLPDARTLLDGLARACRAGRLVLLFDYDGTLAPIVPRPEQALLPEAVRTALDRLRRRVPIAIVSGRDLADVRVRVGLEGVWYAGSHGFEIEGPDGERVDRGAGYAGELERATADLRRLARDFPGARVDRKRYAVALHWRAVPDRHVAALEERVRALLPAHPDLEVGSGKRVLALRPATGWHKGKAARWLLERLGVRDATVVFCGDDVTDEDAFEELAGEAVTVVVGEGDRGTAACWRLPDTTAVEDFLCRLAEACCDTGVADGGCEAAAQTKERSAR
jgi:trehalose-phosphatase